MNKIIPFNKEIKFDGPIGEITSIALDDTLKFTDAYTIGGELIVRGCHKVNEEELDFSYPLPVEIAVDSKYDTGKSKIMVDDFYYEIINDDTLKVKIDLILDDLFYKQEEIIPLERKEVMEEEVSSKEQKETFKEEVKEQVDVTNLFKETNDEEKTYSIYRVYVIDENDTLESILNKYKVPKEELEHYNDLSVFKPGIKLIIPSVDE